MCSVSGVIVFGLRFVSSLCAGKKPWHERSCGLFPSRSHFGSSCRGGLLQAIAVRRSRVSLGLVGAMSDKDFGFLDQLVAPALAVVPKTEPDPDSEQEETSFATASSAAASSKKEAPVAKRRRKLGPLPKANLAQEVKAEGAEDVERLSPSCFGCGRLRDTSPDFRNPVEKVVWLYPDGRGCWCQDCHTVFRTSYQHQHTLRLFERWLRQEANLLDFQLHLFAYVTLSVFLRDGGIIRRQDVTDRVDLLHVFASFLGIPLQPSVMTFLDPEVPLDSASDTRSLFAVETETGVRLAMWKPLLPALAAFAAQPFQRPFFNSWQAFPPTQEQDRVLVQPFVGASPRALLPAVAKTTAVADTGSQAATEASRLDIRLGLLLEKAKKMMAPFESEDWVSLKEGPMAKLMADAAAMQTEASNRGNEKVYRSAGSLATGLCTAKEFAKYLRDHSKNKQPFGRCVELADPAAATAKWLAQQLQMQPSASFTLLALKAGFVQQFLVATSLEQATKHLIDNGLADVFKKQCKLTGKQEHVLSPSLWMRSCFFDALQKTFSKECPDSEEASPVIAEVLADLVAADSLLKDAKPTGFIDEFLLDVSSFVTVLGFGAGKTNPEQTQKHVSEAVSRVTTADYLNFHRGLAQSRVWQRSLTAAAACLQTSSQDSLGDGKLARAHAILQDIRLPHVRESADDAAVGRTAVVENAALLTDGSVVDALGESLGAMSEAMSLWSSVRCETQVVSIRQWAAEIVKAIDGVHELLWLCVAGVIDQCDMSKDAEWTKEQAELLTHSLELLTDDEALLELCGNTFKLMTTLPACACGQEDMEVWARRLQEEIPNSIRARGSVTNVLDLLSGGGLGEEDSVALVAEWRLLRSGGSQQQSPLAHLMEVLAAVEKVRQAGSSTKTEASEHDVTVTLLFNEAGAADAEQLTASLVVSLTLPTRLPLWPVFVRFRDIATESFQHILRKFGDALCLEHAHFNPPADAAAEADGWADAVRRLVTAEAVSVKSIAKVFSKSRDKWPCEAFRNHRRRGAGPFLHFQAKAVSLIRSAFRGFRVPVF